jgi:hypothetical protein
MRVPASEALKSHCQYNVLESKQASSLHGYVVSIELLLVAQSFEVGLYGQWHDGGWIIGEVLFEVFCVHFELFTELCCARFAWM